MPHDTARYYDALHAHKNYVAESEKLRAIIAERHAGARTLLDVGCGTGTHVSLLRAFYQVEGLDLSEALLAVARRRFPEIPFHQGDMTHFRLERGFDVVTCLFSSIAYVGTVERLNLAIATMARALEPGGLLIVEPFLSPERYQEGTVQADFVNEPGIKIARMHINRRQGPLAVWDRHYMIGTNEGVEDFVERVELGLFTREEMLEAFRLAGLAPSHDPIGLTGRGLMLGRATLEA